jgi:hypothetical protein
LFRNGPDVLPDWCAQESMVGPALMVLGTGDSCAWRRHGSLRNRRLASRPYRLIGAGGIRRSHCTRPVTTLFTRFWKLR